MRKKKVCKEKLSRFAQQAGSKMKAKMGEEELALRAVAPYFLFEKGRFTIQVQQKK